MGLVLLDHQKKALELARQHKTFLLALDMGLGKTITSLSIMKQENFDKIFVSIQGSAFDNWERECKLVLPDIPVFKLNGTKKQDDKILDNLPEKYIVLITHGKTWRRPQLETIAKNNHIGWICDESQVLKSFNSNITKFALKFKNYVYKILLLSGTPMSNGYKDLYTTLNLYGSDWKLSDYRKHFEDGGNEKDINSGHYYYVTRGYKNIDNLLECVHSQAMFMKKEQAVDLPEQQIFDITLELDNKKDYNLTQKHRAYKDIHSFANLGVLRMGLRQLASGFLRDIPSLSNHKKQALSDFLDSLGKNDLLIFYNYNLEKYDIIDVVEEKGIKVFELNGDKNDIEKMKQYKGQKVMVAQYISGHKGHNFQDLNYTLYYSPTESAAMWQQSLARTHRIGQTKKCFYYRFITKGTVEPKIIKANEQGVDFSNTMFETYLEEIK